MRKITVKNPEILETPFTYVSDRYTGGSTLQVEDSAGFFQNDLILIGGIGNEKTEVTSLTTDPPNKTSLAISSLNFYHETDESVQKILFDRFDIQYRTSPTGDWVSLVAAEPFDWKQDETTYIDSAGEETYEYRSRYYNSVSGMSSEWSEEVAGAGLTRLTVGYAIEKVRAFAKDKEGKAASDEEIIEFFSSVNDIVKALNRKWWFLKTEEDFLTQAEIAAYNLPDDCERVYRLKYHFDDGTTDIEYYLRFVPKAAFDYRYRDKNADSDDNLVHYTVDWVNHQYLVGPTPKTAGQTITLIYFKKFAEISRYTDELVIPFLNIYTDYAIAQVWRLKEDEQKANYYLTEFSNDIKLLEQMRVKNPLPKQLKKYEGRTSNY